MESGAQNLEVELKDCKHQGGADDCKAQCGSEQLGGTTEGAEGLKGDNKGKAKELDGLGRRGGRGKLGGTIREEGD